MPTLIDCPTCEGQGTSPTGNLECSVCHGVGKMVAESLGNRRPLTANERFAADVAAGRIQPGQALEMPQAPKKIRVLRMLEYVYDDAESMANDIAGWNLGAVSSKRTMAGRGSVKSAVFLPETIEMEHPSNG
jgi:RecJ-like exonuclease